MVCLGVGAQLVGPSAPVLFPLVLLLQALQDAANLWMDGGPGSEGPPGRGREGRLVLAQAPRPSLDVGIHAGFSEQGQMKGDFPVSLCPALGGIFK